MIDYNSLPASEAQELDKIIFADNDLTFTYTVGFDEQKLYDELNTRLIDLEKSIEINNKELKSINNISKRLLIAADEKGELMLRIDWLKRLYQVKETLSSTHTKEEAKSLRKLISPVQTCPLKKQLLSDIEKIEETLPMQQEKVSKPSTNDQLMDKAISSLGEDFLNLGKSGRDYTVAEAISNYGDNADIEDVKELLISLESKVEGLKKLDNTNELIVQLQELPLQLFSTLNLERKREIASTLLKNKRWTGLASLERSILMYNKAIEADLKKREEMKDTIETTEGKAAFTIDIDNVDRSGIKLN